MCNKRSASFDRIQGDHATDQRVKGNVMNPSNEDSVRILEHLDNSLDGYHIGG
eukprot:CAMPEP_0117046056 /NCGR_PEP_ID=MMETSP0472-20121206/31855_1 /TAXON_ID=693140 ORGANISM="Tiarina fusus, Strain LIS" /NCGR_SAMPLE_ID=MMETSP0472 /ASSEMBLY_ACC=CAM_ASM_000603 /LENGTH=52 /DNA_ID=CAMNT_0004758281 /DNA_START=138 /DNA_END=293 /DNA_ORIENTATION=+